MRALVLVLPVMLSGAAQAADADTLCAAVYTYLSESARGNGLDSSGFDDAANRAQAAHLVNYPEDDRGRYTIVVIDGAENLRSGLTSGQISTDSIVVTATNCNGRYYVPQQTSRPGTPAR